MRTIRSAGWPGRLQPTAGAVVTARFDLLDRLGLVLRGDASHIHSVLIQQCTEFTIYLPPGVQPE